MTKKPKSHPPNCLCGKCAEITKKKIAAARDREYLASRPPQPTDDPAYADGAGDRAADTAATQQRLADGVAEAWRDDHGEPDLRVPLPWGQDWALSDGLGRPMRQVPGKPGQFEYLHAADAAAAVKAEWGANARVNYGRRVDEFESHLDSDPEPTVLPKSAEPTDTGFDPRPPAGLPGSDEPSMSDRYFAWMQAYIEAWGCQDQTEIDEQLRRMPPDDTRTAQVYVPPSPGVWEYMAGQFDEADPAAGSTHLADDFLREAMEAMADRAASRDAEDTGERSMSKAVEAFNALFDHALTEVEGWQFMAVLKAARASQGAFRADDYVDQAAYAALAGEAAGRDE